MYDFGFGVPPILANLHITIYIYIYTHTHTYVWESMIFYDKSVRISFFSASCGRDFTSSYRLQVPGRKNMERRLLRLENEMRLTPKLQRGTQYMNHYEQRLLIIKYYPWWIILSLLWTRNHYWFIVVDKMVYQGWQWFFGHDQQRVAIIDRYQLW